MATFWASVQYTALRLGANYMQTGKILPAYDI